MIRYLIFILLCGVINSATAQQKLTTIILVRHAEKVADGSKDPALTPEGIARAANLSKSLSKMKLDAVYSTRTVRTESTVKALADANGVAITYYDPSKFEYLDAILAQHTGGTVVISGHSNTVPGAANYLLGTNDLKNFEDGDYDNILIVTLTQKGSGKLLWMKY
jgi:broad specificity phosphatase PhoE